MKKISGIVMIALVLLVAGCSKEKLYTKDLTGTWHVYKFLYKNVDETAQWLARNPLYSITFTGNGTFTEKNIASVRDTVINGVTYADTTYAYHNSGTYSFANHYVNLILTDTTYVLNDTVLLPTLTQRKYTIFDLSGSDVQLDTDTTQFYLVKQL